MNRTYKNLIHFSLRAKIYLVFHIMLKVRQFYYHLFIFTGCVNDKKGAFKGTFLNILMCMFMKLFFQVIFVSPTINNL